MIGPTALGYTHLKAKLEDRALSRHRHGAVLGAGVATRATTNLDISLDWTLSLRSGKDPGTAAVRHLEGDVSMVSWACVGVSDQPTMSR